MISRITDSEFDDNRTKEYKISIQVSPDGFSFCVIRPVKNRILAFNYEQITLSSMEFIGRRFDEWIDSQDILKNEFSEISLYYSSERYTLIPSTFYDYKNQDAVTNLLFGSNKNCESRDNYISEIAANLVFTIPRSLTEVFEHRFPGVQIQHPVSDFIARAATAEKSQQSLAFLFFNRKSFDLLLFSGERLLTANHFSSNLPADVAYFLFSVLKSKKINTESTALELAGNISEENEIFKTLHKYFKTIGLKKISTGYNPEVFGENLCNHTSLY